MTQEEFLKEYSGKFIEISGHEVAWLFEVSRADFSKGNENFLGWIGAKNIVLGNNIVVEKYYEPGEGNDIILRPEDKIIVYESKEKLEERIFDYLRNTILKYEECTGN